MTAFAVRGFRGRTVHASYSSTPLDVKGTWHLRGPQPVGGAGGAPEWVVDVFEANPLVQFIAVGTEMNGVVYGRMDRMDTPKDEA